MTWNKERSLARVRARFDEVGTIEVTDLTKTMNLEHVKLRQPKRIEGIHVYLGPSNEVQLIDDLSEDDPDAARGILRRIHLYQRELGRIVTDFDAVQVHFQGLRLHALNYRPVGDQRKVVSQGVVMALAAALAARRAFEEVFSEEPAFDCAAGASYGTTLATMSGERGDSELLFIGDAANRGAKVLQRGVRLRVTEEVCDLLDAELGLTVTAQGGGISTVSAGQDVLEEAAGRLGVDWTLETSIKRVRNDAELIPLSAISISKATAEKIDKDRLGLSNSKLNHAVSAFADLDGFTAMVEAATTNAERAALVRDFHVVRYELNYVRKDDHGPTTRIQYQGDRIQVLRHHPHAAPAARALAAVEVASGWQSSMRETLAEILARSELRLAMGVAAGPTLLSKLGTRGTRDVLALGPAVRQAERIQRNLDADELGVDGALRDELPEDIAALFEWRPGVQGHVVEDLRVNQLELAKGAAPLAAGERHSVTPANGGLTVGAGLAVGALLGGAAAAAARKPRPKEERVTPKRRWAS